MSGAFRDALRELGQIDVVHFFSVRAVVMKSLPKFVPGAHNAAMRIALQEIEEGFQSQNEERQSRGWNLFLLLPRMLFFGLSRRPHPKATVARQILALLDRVDPESRPCGSYTQQRRAERTQTLVLMGEVSAGRHALDGASLAQRTQETAAVAASSAGSWEVG